MKMRRISCSIKLLISCLLALGSVSGALAATNIDSVNRWAWSDIMGWLDFFASDTVTVTSTEVTGWATSKVGAAALNCASSPIGNICGTSNFKVSNSTSTFQLSGWGWNDAVGWISFNCLTFGNCTQSNYKVSIDPANGTFSGWAWSDIAGWISFNCADPGLCGASNYKVVSGWRYVPASGSLISSIFDTQVTGGSAINTIMWLGTQPSGTQVFFQIASANCSNGATNPPTCTAGVGWGDPKTSGDGAFVGPDGTSSSFYNPGVPDKQVQVNLAHHNNKRYWRYKVIIETNPEQTISPTVMDVMINWSP